MAYTQTGHRFWGWGGHEATGESETAKETKTLTKKIIGQQVGPLTGSEAERITGTQKKGNSLVRNSRAELVVVHFLEGSSSPVAPIKPTTFRDKAVVITMPNASKSKKRRERPRE
jgi:hypothetical protein